MDLFFYAQRRPASAPGPGRPSTGRTRSWPRWRATARVTGTVRAEARWRHSRRASARSSHADVLPRPCRRPLPAASRVAWEDRHVVGTALAGRADGIVTFNRRDFLRRNWPRTGCAYGPRTPSVFVCWRASRLVSWRRCASRGRRSIRSENTSSLTEVIVAISPHCPRSVEPRRPPRARRASRGAYDAPRRRCRSDAPMILGVEAPRERVVGRDGGMMRLPVGSVQMWRRTGTEFSATTGRLEEGDGLVRGEGARLAHRSVVRHYQSAGGVAPRSSSDAPAPALVAGDYRRLGLDEGPTSRVRPPISAPRIGRADRRWESGRPHSQRQEGQDFGAHRRRLEVAGGVAS